jgi:hypothetical protein
MNEIDEPNIGKFWDYWALLALQVAGCRFESQSVSHNLKPATRAAPETFNTKRFSFFPPSIVYNL